MVWALLMIAAIAVWPRSMVWGLSRVGYLLLFFLGGCITWVVFFSG